jgi:hypothetical protein
MRRAAILLAASAAGAYLCAVAYLAVLYATLPPDDGAREGSLLDELRDPFVQDAAHAVILPAIPVAFVLGLALLRGRRLALCLPLAFASALVAIALATPLSPRAGLVAGPVALVGALAFCRLAPLAALREPRAA